MAEGVYAGAHRSARRGAGVEFGGHREYAPGDDLRWLDRRSCSGTTGCSSGSSRPRPTARSASSSTRPRRWATAAPARRGRSSRSRPLVAAALARVAIASGDPVGLTFLGGGEATRSVPVAGGREPSSASWARSRRRTPAATRSVDLTVLDRGLGGIARAARRGSIVVVLSDLLDLPEGAAERVAAIASRGRVLIVVQVLDPDEVDFPFGGTVRLRALEGGVVVETDAEVTRAAYQASLASLTSEWERLMTARGARLVRAVTMRRPRSHGSRDRAGGEVTR